MNKEKPGKKRLFIESPLFPVEAVMAASAKEKGPGRPPFWEMLFWWTRKPLAGARALLLAAALSEEEVLGDRREPVGKGLHPGVRRFLQAIYPTIDWRRSKPPNNWVFTKTPHYANPRLPEEWKRKISEMSVADPMAGFGNIPLEALRLGFGSVYAWDLLPMARLILRAVLEYPAKYGPQLAKDVERYGKQLIEMLEKDPDIQELYDKNTAVYIGTWEVKCPYCGRYTPLVGNWWLARVKDQKGNYKALAWMEPVKEGDTIKIRINDLTSQLDKTRIIQVTKTQIKTTEKTYKIPQPNINPRRNEATCLHCGAKIKGTRDNWHVKQAIREWNQNLEKYLNGQITLQELLQTKARPTLLAKIKTTNKKLIFLPSTQQDQQKQWKALEKLKQNWPDPDIPTETTPSYENRRFIYPYGFDKWYKLFNPRQLLTHTKTIKYIRQITKQIIQEQQKQGKTPEQTKLYTKTIISYIVLLLLKYINYNSIVTSVEPTLKIIRETLSFRGIAMTWNFTEQSLYYKDTGSLNKNIKSILKSILYLYFNYKINYRKKKKFINIVVLDPPYFDDVPYAELSDFYFVWAKRALSDSDGFGLRPLFHEDLFWDEFGGEIRTQWERFAVDDLTFNPGRMRYFGLCNDRDECLRVYKERFKEKFARVAGMLSEDGVMVAYFAHSRREAWELLVESAMRAGLRVSAGFPLPTESPNSIVSRGKASILQSMVLVLRRGREGEIDLSSAEDSLVDRLAGFVGDAFRAGHAGFTVYAMTYARAIGLLLGFERVRRGGRVLGASDIVSEAARLAARAFAVESGGRPRSEEAVLYVLLKRVLPRTGKGVRRVESDSLIILGYGTMGPGEAERRGLVKSIGRPKEGSSVAKRKVYEILEPVNDSEREIGRLLGLVPGGRDGYRPRGVIDVLRILEYYSFRPKRIFDQVLGELEGSYGFLVDDALELAKALCHLKGDPEASLARRVLEKAGIGCASTDTSGSSGIERWM